MKTYPARFVGEFTREDAPRLDFVQDIGDVAILRGFAQWYVNAKPDATFLQVKCACGSVDEVALDHTVQQNGANWRLISLDPVHVEPSIVSILGPWTTDDGVERVTRCHYFVHGGQLQMLDDTTAELP